MVIFVLIVALMALLVSGFGIFLMLAWRGDVGRLSDLADRLDAETRLEYLTTQTLGAMRDLARRHLRNDDLP